MTHGEAIAQSRARVKELELDLAAEKIRLRTLETECKHQREAHGAVKITVIDGVLVHACIKCVDCGVVSFISKNDPSKRNYPKAVLRV